MTLQGLTKDGKAYFEKLARLESVEIRVGFFEGQEYPDGTAVAQVAAENELGDSNRPARPFMRQTFENHEGELNKALTHVDRVVAEGGDVDAALDETGQFLVGLMQTEIVDGGFAPNSPATVAQKGSSQPLIDTGFMRQSVSYRIVENKEQ